MKRFMKVNYKNGFGKQRRRIFTEGVDLIIDKRGRWTPQIDDGVMKTTSMQMWSEQL